MINQLANLNRTGAGPTFTACFLLGALWPTLFFSKQYKISLVSIILIAMK